MKGLIERRVFKILAKRVVAYYRGGPYRVGAEYSFHDNIQLLPFTEIFVQRWYGIRYITVNREYK